MKILIIDDEKSIRLALGDVCEDEGYEVSMAEDGAKGYEVAKDGGFDVIFCDIKMPRMDGVEVLKKLVEEGVESSIIMITGHGDVETAVECIKLGAYDFIQKPLDLSRILVTIRNAADKSSNVKEIKSLKKKIAKSNGFQEIIGNSKAIVEVRDMIDRVAPTDARVLIMGENGTGKELVARWLHLKSNRASMPFVEVNCAAIPGELIESELFGHEKGSFTSAVKQHKGKFEQANGGTLFLDEIGDMSLAAQAKVLRVLQENKLSRVGSDTDINVNVRVLAATNKNIPQEIERGNFREDLYHRLSVIVINVPSLANRKDDIPLLVNYFIKKICQESGSALSNINKDALEELKKHSWGGNIRELRNVVERLLILGGKTITKEDVIKYASPIFK